MTVPQDIVILSQKTYTVVLKNGFVCTVTNSKTKITLNNIDHGISFYSDGKVCTYTAGIPGDDTDYCVAEILSNPLPDLPKGYKWAGGWPTLRILENNEFFLSNYPNYYGNYGADINSYNVMGCYKRIVLEKIEANTVPAPTKEDPEDYVDITDLYPNMMARDGIDSFINERHLAGNNIGWKLETAGNKESPSCGKYTIGEWYKQRQIRHRCKRKDLPTQQDTPNKYPIYYSMREQDKTYAKFVIKTSCDTCSPIGHDGKPYRKVKSEVWGSGEDNSVKNGLYILSSKEEYDKWLASLTPVQNDTPKEYPIYYTVGPRYGNKFIVRTSEGSCYLLSLSGKKGDINKWRTADTKEVDNKNYTLSSQEEYDKFMMSINHPPVKYYIHNNRSIGDGYLSYIKQTGDEFVQYSFLGGVSRGEPKAIQDVIKTSYTEVSEKEALEFHNSEWPNPVYYAGKSDSYDFVYKYIIRTSIDRCLGIQSDGTTVVRKFSEDIRKKISDAVYFPSSKSEVTNFLKDATTKRLSGITEATTPKVSKIKWAANYFITEPIVTVSKTVAKSFRYVLLGAVLGGGAYAYTHPEQVGRLLPKISIKVSAPQVIRG